VFFGVSAHTHFDRRDVLIYAHPRPEKLSADDDFRDWARVDTWADRDRGCAEPVAAG